MTAKIIEDMREAGRILQIETKFMESLWDETRCLSDLALLSKVLGTYPRDRLDFISAARSQLPLYLQRFIEQKDYLQLREEMAPLVQKVRDVEPSLPVCQQSACLCALRDMSKMRIGLREAAGFYSKSDMQEFQAEVPGLLTLASQADQDYPTHLFAFMQIRREGCKPEEFDRLMDRMATLMIPGMEAGMRTQRGVMVIVKTVLERQSK